jgi:hypothetical protein
MSIRLGRPSLQCLRRRNTARLGGALVAGLAAFGLRSSISTGSYRVTQQVGSIWSAALDLYSKPLHLQTRSISFASPFSSAMSFTPPQKPPTWDHNADQILSITKELINQDRAVQDKIGALKPEECTFESVSE